MYGIKLFYFDYADTMKYMYRVSQKNIPQGFLAKILLTAKNFKAQFYTLIICSYLHKIIKFYLIIFKFDKVITF